MHCRVILRLVFYFGWYLFFGLFSPWPAEAFVPYQSQSNTVGRIGANRYLTPTGQILTPAGRQVELPGLRPQAIALSPDGKLLATSGKRNVLVLIKPETGQILQRLSLSTNYVAPLSEDDEPNFAGLPSSAKIKPPPMLRAKSASSSLAPSTNTTASTNKPPSTSDSQISLSLSGLIFSPDSQRIYISTVAGTVRVFAVNKNRAASSLKTFYLPEAKAPNQKREVPAGLALSADGRRLYVAGNLGNRLHELDSKTGQMLRSWDTGVAPDSVAVVAGKAYVSNRGGRRPDKGDLTAPAGRGTRVRVDPVQFLPEAGTVTVIDLATGMVKTEIPVEQHASALAVSPDKRYLVVANTGSDTLSVIDTRVDRVVEKIWTRQTPADLFGAQPSALAFDRRGRYLFVCNGTQNAVAVVQFEPKDNASKVIGLIPAGWFPSAIEYDDRRRVLYVANMKGIGANKDLKPGDKFKLSTKDYYGTLSLIPQPSNWQLDAMTRIALQNMCYPKLAEALLPPRPNQPPRPVPERAGEPSVFKHVIYIIKENRTYDQVLGDMKEGNGRADLCIFGEKFTPNQHRLAREFVLLDNTYCSGVQSADGHQWTDSALANEYVERQLTADYPRSYSSGKSDDGLDALAWASSGFIWDLARSHGKSFRNYGEWMISQADWRDKKGHKEKPHWLDFWQDYVTGGNLTRLASRAGIGSLRPCSATNTVGWDLNVPDVMRAEAFIQELRQFETNGGFPQLVMIFLPNDHTGGTRGRRPTPGAQIADNDLALGRIVEAVSHSKFWPETCLFAIEDDPQAGWDHVSGYRTTCYVASPYTKRRQTISTAYNQTSLIRTIELILGLPPMNQMDGSATPMSDCFMETPDYTPFTSVPNRTPLDELSPEPKKITNPILRKDAILSARLPLDEPDRCPEDLLNRILWRAMKGPDIPYPEWAIKLVEEEEEED